MNIPVKAFLLVLLAVSAVRSADAEVISKIVAVVNDDIITTLDLDKEFKIMAREANRKDPFPPEERAKLHTVAVSRLVDRRLVDQKIIELNIKISEEEIRQSIEEVKKQNSMSQERLIEALAGQGLSFEQYSSQIREQLERLRLMSQEVKAKVQVQPKEVLDYYIANLEKYGAQELFQARHIVLAIPKGATDDDIARIMEKGDAILKEARGGSDFIMLAKKYSDDPNAEKDGGELGTFKRGDLLPEMEAVVLKLKPGEVSEPIRSKTGFHIVKLENRYFSDSKPFDSVKAELEETLYKQKSEARFNQWVSDMRKNASIDIRTP